MHRDRRRADDEVMTRRGEHGFSLVELLVVMVIVAVLAGIAIPVFLSQREKSFRSAAVSDLRAVRTAEASWIAESDVYTENVDDLIAMGYRPSDGVQPAEVRVTGDEYLACVKHMSLDDWIVFNSVTGTTAYSPTNDCS